MKIKKNKFKQMKEQFQSNRTHILYFLAFRFLFMQTLSILHLQNLHYFCANK